MSTPIPVKTLVPTSNLSISQLILPMNQITGLIHAIFGEVPWEISQTSLKIEEHMPLPQELAIKKFKWAEMITCSKLDDVSNVMPHLDTHVIKMILGNKEVKIVYVDNGTAVSIIYKGYFDKLGIIRTHLKPCFSLLTFGRGEVTSEGIVTSLPL